MTYKFLKNPRADSDLTNVVLRLNPDGTLSSIPNDPRNREWQEYLAWLAAGNVTTPSDPLPAEPASN